MARKAKKQQLIECENVIDARDIFRQKAAEDINKGAQAVELGILMKYMLEQANSWLADMPWVHVGHIDRMMLLEKMKELVVYLGNVNMLASKRQQSAGQVIDLQEWRRKNNR